MDRTGLRIVMLGVAALRLIIAGSGPAEAAFTFTFLEQGGDVVATGSGSIDLGGLSPVRTDVLPNSGTIPKEAVVGVAGTVSVYSGITGPGSIGPGGFVTASSGGGEAAAVNGSLGVLGVPTGYVSGSAFSNNMVFTGQTFASLGLIPGTYSWTWDTGAMADRVTVQIGPTAVPEPATSLLLGAALLGFAAAYRLCGPDRLGRRRRR